MIARSLKIFCCAVCASCEEVRWWKYLRARWATLWLLLRRIISFRWPWIIKRYHHGWMSGARRCQWLGILGQTEQQLQNFLMWQQTTKFNNFYFWNFPSNNFRPWLSTGNWNRPESKRSIRWRDCHKSVLIRHCENTLGRILFGYAPPKRICRGRFQFCVGCLKCCESIAYML